MINSNLLRRGSLLICLVIGSGGLSPLQAHRTAQAEVPAAAAAAASATKARPGPRPRTYCIEEAIASRIVKRMCKTAKGWDEVGVDLPVKF